MDWFPPKHPKYTGFGRVIPSINYSKITFQTKKKDFPITSIQILFSPAFLQHTIENVFWIPGLTFNTAFLNVMHMFQYPTLHSRYLNYTYKGKSLR
jgi:hypothetical protein